ncbi:toll/interleukin-1 receptor domain-containing protein [Cryptosporangium arvum]|uniref:TIR domain-containing protein n=1 Tax=Cryptosporangium arvum DSM 44712 TaxID=927661 RepID=A0A010ZLF2_9ACTN|nr:toll/interleukin-1 receptor domain-containing protein [Cryptosporangium arvum]EXG79499.1 hypothetical protein CryarDRAFT_0540 [Cryptosporangium arvum DSM 44712]
MAKPGKTEAAIEYCYRYSQNYDVIWWFDSTDVRNTFKECELKCEEAATRIGGPRSLFVFDCPEGDTRVDGLLALLNGDAPLALRVATELPAAWSGPAVRLGRLARSESAVLLGQSDPLLDPEDADALGSLLGDEPFRIAQLNAMILAGAVDAEVALRLLRLTALSALSEQPVTTPAVVAPARKPSQRLLENVVYLLSGAAAINTPERRQAFSSLMRTNHGLYFDIDPALSVARYWQELVERISDSHGSDGLRGLAAATHEFAPDDPATMSIEAALRQLADEAARTPPGQSYRFFLSYSRRDVDQHRVLEFWRALKQQTQTHARRAPKEYDGYIDQNMQLGSHWPSKLYHAATTSRVLIALCSRDYFERSWCGLEWAVFNERARRAGEDTVGILPLRWGDMGKADWPDGVRDVMHTTEALDSVYGGLSLADFGGDHSYRDFVRILSQIIHSLPNSPDLPKLTVEEVNGLTPTFGNDPRPKLHLPSTA